MSFCASVVVPTYQRPDLLDRCLASLCEQDFPRYRYEIIVVDDECAETTRDQVARWAKQCCCEGGPSIRYLSAASSQGPAAARNLGWRSASSSIIAFTDDDCIPTRSWLRNGLAAFSDGVSGVSGRVTVPIPERPTDYELNIAFLEDSRFLTASCFYSRAALEDVGGFDERFELAWREDSDLQYTLREAGHRLIDAPEAVVIHPVRPASWGVSVSLQRKSMYNALLHKKHPQLFPWSVRSGPRWHYYGIVAAAALAIAGFTSGRRTPATLGLAGWSFLTGRFTISRLRGTSRRPAHIAEMLVTSIAIPPLSIFWRVRDAIRYRVIYF